MRKRRILSIIAMTLLVVALHAACATKEPPPEQKRYQVRGKVVSVDKNEKLVYIAHEEIPGFMMAMTMGFKLKDPRDYERLQRGDRVEATLVVQGLDSWLETLFITRPANPDADTPSEPPAKLLPMPKMGDAVPDVTLVNQDNQPITLRALRGKVLVLTFFFTRCPLPNFCPLMNMNMSKIAKQQSQNPAQASRTQLLSISFDPHDTPAVLRKYRESFVPASTKSAVAWEFVTGKPEQIRKLANFFGLSYDLKGKNAEDTVHTLRTVVINPEGKVVKIFTGNTWTVEEVLAELKGL